MDWLALLKACSRNMRKEVLPLLGLSEAKVGFGMGAGGDVTEKIDVVAENALIQTLQERNVSCILISEECGIKRIGSEPFSFYLTADPLDGTTNAVRGLPFAAISLALSTKPQLNDVRTALVTDILHNSTYTAELGKGAFKDGKRIKPSDAVNLEEAVIGLDLSTLKSRQDVEGLGEILEKTRHLRHLGANALELCYVADGLIDAFIDLRGKLRVTDMVAAQFIIREAGGIITTSEGTELNVPLNATQKVAFIAAANRTLYELIQRSKSPLQ